MLGSGAVSALRWKQGIDQVSRFALFRRNCLKFKEVTLFYLLGDAWIDL